MSRWRVAVFIAVTVICLAGATVFVLRSGSSNPANVATAGDAAPGNAAPAAGASVSDLASRPHLVFRGTRLGDGFGRLGVVALDAPEGALALTDLRCERVDFAADRGVCLTAERGAVTTYSTVVFDREFHTLSTSPLAGLPSRARVSPDGHYAATTTFVSGDSYAGANFSTRTNLMDLRSGAALGDLEQFSVQRDGERVESVDFNFWGVTFARDPNRFYATLGTGGHTYLVEGDIAQRQVNVLRDGVECPMLSPDNRRLAFKKRVTGQFGRVEWRLSVLDLDTLAEHPLAETRNVDDQAQWLDDTTVLYALPEAEEGTPTTDTWAVPADGTGTPRRLLAGAWSPSPVRP